MSDKNNKNTEITKSVSFIMWLCLTLFYCYQYILRILPNIFMEDIITIFNINAKNFGAFASIYYFGYVLFHIPIGILFSKYNAKHIIAFSIVITALGILPLNYSDSWYLSLFGRFLSGVGSSAAAVGALQILRIAFPGALSRMLGLMVCAGLLTAVYANQYISSIQKHIDNYTIINGLFLFGAVLSVISYIIMPSIDDKSEDSMLNDIKSILFNRKIIITGLCAGLMVGPIEGFADAWGSAFFANLYGFDKITSDSIVSSIFIGMCFGCIILPYIAEKTQKHYSTVLLSGIVMLIAFVYLLLNITKNQSLLYWICILIGIASGYQVVIIPKITTFVPISQSSTAGAFANMLIMMFGAVFHNSIGITLDNLGKTVNGIITYSGEAFIRSMLIIPCTMIIAICYVAYFTVKEYKKR